MHPKTVPSRGQTQQRMQIKKTAQCLTFIYLDRIRKGARQQFYRQYPFNAYVWVNPNPNPNPNLCFSFPLCLIYKINVEPVH